MAWMDDITVAELAELTELVGEDGADGIRLAVCTGLVKVNRGVPIWTWNVYNASLVVGGYSISPDQADSLSIILGVWAARRREMEVPSG